MAMYYEIKGKKYSQKKLVLGQMAQLIELLDGVRIEQAGVTGMLKAIGGKLPMALAICLIPEGCASIGEKNNLAIAVDMQEAEIDQAIEVVGDFLSCNQLSSLLEKLGALAERVAVESVGSKNSSAPLPTET